ncbi:MAG TPA: hypothetical protein VF756_25030 [Thermoanaerobaculia bacterium]
MIGSIVARPPFLSEGGYKKPGARGSRTDPWDGPPGAPAEPERRPVEPEGGSDQPEGAPG